MRRMILPIIKKYWKLLLSTVLVSALGCGIMIGMSSSYTSLERSLNDYVTGHRYPDAYITTDVVNRRLAEDVLAIEGVDTVNTRLCGDTVLLDANGRYLSVRVFSYNENDLQKFHIWRSAETDGRDSIMLECNFAEDNGIEVGSEVSFRVGDEMRTYLVSAIVSAPETLKVQITEGSFGSNSDFGYAYAPVSLLEKEERKDRDDAKQELDDETEKLNEAEKEAESALADSKEKLDEAKALLEEQEALFADAQAEAEENIAKLRETEAQLNDSLAQLNDALSKLNAAEPQLTEGREQAAEAIALLEQAKQSLAEIDSALSQLNAAKAQLTDPSVVDAVDMIRPLPSNTRLDDLFSSMNGLQAFMAVSRYYGLEITENTPVSTVVAMLNEFMDGIDADYEYLGSDKVRALIARAEAGEDITGDPEFIRMLTVILRYDESYLDGAPITDAYQRAYERVTYMHNYIEENDLRQAVVYLSLMGEGRNLGEVYANLEILKRLRTELANNSGHSISRTGQLVNEYDTQLAQINSQINDLKKQRRKIKNQLAQNGITESNLDSKLSELRRQLAEIENQLASLPETREQLLSSRAEIEDGLAQIADGITQIEASLEEGREQLDNARSEYNEGLAQYEESFSDAAKEFAELRDELAKAYEQLDDQEGYDSLCNQFLLYTKQGFDRQEVLKKVESALAPSATVKKSYAYEDSPVYDIIKQNLDTVKTLSTFMPMVFFVVILIVVFLFMSLVIKQCRREIGILRALGFTKNSVRLLFCGVELAAAFAAVLLGIGLGMAVMAYVGHYYRGFFPIPSVTYKVNVPMLLLAAVLTVLVGEAATLIGTSVISRIHPSEAMTRPAPETAKIPRVIGALTKGAKPMVKFSISTLLRNKGRFVFSVICISASVMMIFASLAFKTSKNHALRQLYELRINYDCQIFFNEAPTDAQLDELGSLSFVRDVQRLGYYESEFAFGSKKKSAVVNAADPATQLIGVFDKNENKLAIPNDGVVIERHLAEYLGAGVGDTVTIDGKPFKITDISEQSLSRSQYISLASAEALGNGSLGCVILNIDEADEQKLLAYLTENDDYLFSVFTRLAYQGNQRVFNTYDLATTVIIAFAILIGFTIVFNTAQTNLLEKKKELCILKTLGFSHGEISASWFVQSLLQFICSCALGLPLGILIGKAALVRLSNDVREFVFANSAKEYLFTAGLVFAYIVVSHFLSMNSLRHWNMVETVKEKE